MFFGFSDPERAKKRQLKLIAKSLLKDRYKFYKPRTRDVAPGLARLMYETYKTISAARKLVQPTDSSGALRCVVIESLMSDEQSDLRRKLDEQAIREAARGADLRTLSTQIKDTLFKFIGSFANDQIKAINQLHGSICAFVAFIHFDFYFTLKKFDSAINEDSFSYKPRWDTLSCDYVVDDIKDFLELAVSIPPAIDYDAVFTLLKTYRGVQVVDQEQWRKVARSLRDVISSGVLERLVQHAIGDPSWNPKAVSYQTQIVEPYFNEIKATVEAAVQKLGSERRHSKIEQLLKAVFGTTVIARAKNYTQAANTQFAKTQIDGYTHTEPLNYLKAYLLDHFKKDVREIVQDLLIVRGQWATNAQAQQVSDAYHGVLSVSERVVKLDDALDPEGEVGQKLRRALGRVAERDPGTQRVLRDFVAEINDQMRSAITEAAHNLIVIGKNLKLVIEDAGRKEATVILNWRELDAEIEEPIQERMTAVYKQIYHLVQLLQIYVGKNA